MPQSRSETGSASLRRLWHPGQNVGYRAGMGRVRRAACRGNGLTMRLVVRVEIKESGTAVTCPVREFVAAGSRISRFQLGLALRASRQLWSCCSTRQFATAACHRNRMSLRQPLSTELYTALPILHRQQSMYHTVYCTAGTTVGMPSKLELDPLSLPRLESTQLPRRTKSSSIYFVY